MTPEEIHARYRVAVLEHNEVNWDDPEEEPEDDADEDDDDLDERDDDE